MDKYTYLIMLAVYGAIIDVALIILNRRKRHSWLGLESQLRRKNPPALSHWRGEWYVVRDGARGASRSPERTTHHKPRLFCLGKQTFPPKPYPTGSKRRLGPGWQRQIRRNHVEDEELVGRVVDHPPAIQNRPPQQRGNPFEVARGRCDQDIDCVAV